MSVDQLITIIFLGVSLFTVYVGIFSIRKDRFLNTDDFIVFRDGLLPPIINFWLTKGFLILGGLFMSYFAVQLVIREFT